MKEDAGYELIKAWLREQIDGGKYAEGALLPSENELAEQFGVNRNHSRRALRELAVEGYVTRSQGRRSCVAPSSSRVRPLPLFTSDIVSIVFPVFQTLFSRTIVEGFMRYVSERGIQCIAYNIQMEPEAELAFLRQAPDLGVKGLAIWLQHDTPETREVLQGLHERQFPVVLFDRYLEGIDLDHVVTNNEELGYRLTKELIQRGHKRIGFMTDLECVSSIMNRTKGYKRALEESELEYRQEFTARVEPLNDEAVRLEINAVMGYRNPPTAFFCIHDYLAKSLADTLLQLDYRIPEDVEIAAVDDEHYPEELGIPMLTAAQPGYEMGRQTAEVLLARIESPGRPVEQRSLMPSFDNELTTYSSQRVVKHITN